MCLCPQRSFPDRLILMFCCSQQPNSIRTREYGGYSRDRSFQYVIRRILPMYTQSVRLSRRPSFDVLDSHLPPVSTPIRYKRSTVHPLPWCMHLHRRRCDTDLDDGVHDDARREDHQWVRGWVVELGSAHVPERDLAGGSCESKGDCLLARYDAGLMYRMVMRREESWRASNLL